MEMPSHRMNILETLRDFFSDEKEPFVFKDEWILLLEANVPLYSRLPEETQSTLHKKMGEFIRSTFFEGCNGLELYAELESFYRLDPAVWFTPPA